MISREALAGFATNSAGQEESDSKSAGGFNMEGYLSTHGFEVLRRNTAKQDTGISLRDALRVYLNRQAACAPAVIDDTDTEMPQRSVVDRYGSISCLDETIEPHDGRVRPVFE